MCGESRTHGDNGGDGETDRRIPRSVPTHWLCALPLPYVKVARPVRKGEWRNTVRLCALLLPYPERYGCGAMQAAKMPGLAEGPQGEYTK